jgi:hypothetical protein
VNYCAAAARVAVTVHFFGGQITIAEFANREPLAPGPMERGKIRRGFSGLAPTVELDIGGISTPSKDR